MICSSFNRAIFALISLGLALPAIAAEPTPFQLSGSLAADTQTDITTRSDSPADERTDINATVELAATLTLPAYLSLNSVAVFETVRDPAPGKDRFFDDQGLYMEELFLAWDNGRFGLKGGKFGQNFGIAWGAAPGIWGTDLAEDYEIAEQIGIGGQFHHVLDKDVKLTYSLSTFFADTSVLSHSLFVTRGTTRRADGGPGNTEGFDSFAAAVDGDIGGVRVHAGLLSRAGDHVGGHSEQGLALGATGTFNVGAVSVTPLVEVATLKDKGGVRAADTDYFTTSVELGWNKATFALASTLRNAETVDDSQIQISVGYALPYGFGVQAGYRRLDSAGVSSDTVGFVVSYGVEF